MRRIFLVEDDGAIARNLTCLLRSEDFAVTQASTQAEAFSILNEERFDLALVDVSLPDGNGFTVCTEIKETQDIPVIFLTASGDEASVVTGLNMGGGRLYYQAVPPNHYPSGRNGQRRESSAGRRNVLYTFSRVTDLLLIRRAKRR